MIRRACFSGSWYPDEYSTVNSVIDEWLSASPIINNGDPKCIVVPHAGWRYSGYIAASAFKQFENRNVTRVFVLGPCHHYYSESCILSEASEFESPLGNIEIDVDCVRELMKSRKFSTCGISIEEEEHSIEIEVPFIIKCLGPSVKIVPIMVGKISSQLKKEYAKVLKKYIEDDESVFVISSDFCHWGSSFRFQYYNPDDGEIWRSIEKLDRLGAMYICDGDADGFAEYIETYHNTICGRNCIEIMLRALKESGLTTTSVITKYGQSAQVRSLKDRSVSYCAIVTYV